jgi:hypothetical protein
VVGVTVTAMARYRIRNIEHHNAIVGGIGSPHDRGCVVDESRVEQHPITGAEQPSVVYIGTMSECAEWLRKAEHPYTPWSEPTMSGGDSAMPSPRCKLCGVSWMEHA